MDFKVGKKYNFFDDGKVFGSRHYIATVKEIIPIEKYDAAIWLEEEIDRKEYLNLYSEHPKMIVIANVLDYKDNLIFIKMKYSENYYSIGDNVWQGELYTPKRSKDLKILLNHDFHKDLIKSLI